MRLRVTPLLILGILLFWAFVRPPAGLAAPPAGRRQAFSREDRRLPPGGSPARPWRVGLQVGHWRIEERPAELEKVYGSKTGYGAINEVDLNLDIAQRAKALLDAQGVIVDLLPATVPPGYQADAFVAIHADGDERYPLRHGWKSVAPWRASRAAQDLNAALVDTYGAATDLPFDSGGITLDMRGYYAFNYHRFSHAIAPTTPAVIIELGFMSSADDRAILLDQPDRAAAGIADGVLRYLRERDPNDRAALEPLDLPVLRPHGRIALRDQPDSSAEAVAELGIAQRLVPFSQRDDWYFVAVRGDWGLTGWVRQDQVLPIALPAAERELCGAAGARGC